MYVISWLAFLIGLMLSTGVHAEDIPPVKCQAYFASHTLRHENSFAPWSTLPLLIQPYFSVHLAVRVQIPAGRTVPLERLGLEHDALLIPPSFVHARAGSVYALLAGDKYTLMAAAEELSRRYGEANLSFQVVAEPGASDIVHLPLPTRTESFATPPWQMAPLTEDVVLVDVEGDRHAVGFATHAVSVVATRAFKITWLTDEKDALARLRRNERFALDVPGGVVLSGAAYAMLKHLEPRPLDAGMDILLPELPDAGETDEHVRHEILDLVDAQSIWSINAFLRDFTKPNFEYRVRSILFHSWRMFAPQDNPSAIWRRVRAAKLGRANVSGLETAEPALVQSVIAVWRDLREAVRVKAERNEPDFDPRAHEPTPDDALEIVITLQTRYTGPKDMAGFFKSLWNEELGTDGPTFEFDAKTIPHVLFETNEAASHSVVAAYAEFLRQRKAHDAARAPEVEPEHEPVSSTPVDLPEFEYPDLEFPLLDEPVLTTETVATVTSERAGNRTDSSAHDAKGDTADRGAKPASTKDVEPEIEPLTWPIPPDRDVSQLPARTILFALRSRFALNLKRPGVAQSAFDQLYEEDLGSPAPDFKFTRSAARNAAFEGTQSASRAVENAFAQYVQQLRRVEDERAIALQKTNSTVIESALEVADDPEPADESAPDVPPEHEEELELAPTPSESEADSKPDHTPLLDPAPAPIVDAAPTKTVFEVPAAPNSVAIEAPEPAIDLVAMRVSTIRSVLAQRLGVSVERLGETESVFETLLAWDAVGRTISGTFSAREFREVATDPHAPAAAKLVRLFEDYDQLTTVYYGQRMRRVRALARVPAHWTHFLAKTLPNRYGRDDARMHFRRLWRRLLPSVAAHDVEALLARIDLRADDLEHASTVPLVPDVHRRLRATWRAFLTHVHEIHGLEVDTFDFPRPKDATDLHRLLVGLARAAGVDAVAAPNGINEVFYKLVDKLDPVHRDVARGLVVNSGLRWDENERLRSDHAATHRRIMKLYTALFERITGDVAVEPSPTPELPVEGGSIGQSVRFEMQDALERHSGVTLSSRRGFGKAFAALLERLLHRPRHAEARAAFELIEWRDDDYVALSRGDAAAQGRLRRAWRVLQLLCEPDRVGEPLDLTSVKRTRARLGEALRGA